MQPTSRRCGGGAAPGPEPHGEARPPGAPRASDVLCARLRGFSRRRVFAPRRCSGSCCVRSSVLAVGTPGPPMATGQCWPGGTHGSTSPSAVTPP